MGVKWHDDPVAVLFAERFADDDSVLFTNMVRQTFNGFGTSDHWCVYAHRTFIEHVAAVLACSSVETVHADAPDADVETLCEALEMSVLVTAHSGGHVRPSTLPGVMAAAIANLSPPPF